MLEKTKKWCKNKIEKGKEWFKENRLAIGFGLGSASALASVMLIDKLCEPKEGAIEFIPKEDENYASARIFYKDRFGKEYNPLNIGYDTTGEAWHDLTNKVMKIEYPGD